MGHEEFDKFAGQYRELHAENIRASGEEPEFFAEYKVKDAGMEASGAGLREHISLLDFGTGIGSSIPFFRKYFPQARITGLDVSRESLELAGEEYGEYVRFQHFDGQTIPFADDSFDLAFAACVFHHIPEDQHVPLLREIQRVMKPGGLLMLFEHNPWNPLTVRAVNTCPLDENARLITGPAMRQRIRKAGFSSPSLRYRIFFPGSLGFLRPLEQLLGWFPLGAQYYVRGGGGGGGIRDYN